MHISIIAVGQKMPSWVYQSCDDYIKRMPREIDLHVREIPLGKRGKNPDIERIKRDESRAILDSVPAGAVLVALEVSGKRLTTEQLSVELDGWMREGRDVCFAIGGPDGFSQELLCAAHRKISLSDLTFPHPLVRVIIVEQLYRSWSILKNHTYHRA